MRRNVIAIALILGAALAALPAGAAPAPCDPPAAIDDGWPVEADPAAAGFAPGPLCEALRVFAQSPRNLHALLVERHGRLVAEAYRDGADRSTYSPWSSQTRFDSGVLHDVRSITKSVVALLWGIARAEGVVPGLETPVLDLLPALADLRTGGRERITIADMLCMRSGLAWDESGGYGRLSNDETALLWRGDRARYVFDRPMAASPGAQFTYNSGLTTVLGMLLEQHTGMSLPAYARQKLFEPLGIRDWEWVADVRGRARGSSGLRMRPRDLARIGRLMLQGGRWQERQVVPAAWAGAVAVPCGAAGYGYQWWSGSVAVRGRQFAWHGALGNGGQRLFIVPALDLVVVTTAGEYGDSTIGRAQRHLLEQVVAATLEARRQPAASGNQR